MANYGRNFVPDQEFYLGALGNDITELRGVQSVDINWSLPEEAYTALGAGAGNVVQGAVENSIGIQRLIVTDSDPALAGNVFFPESGLEGVLVYGSHEQRNKAVVFNSGYITSYESSCAIGDVASSDLTVTVYGDLGEGETGALSFVEDTEAATIPLPGNISVNVSGYDSNAVQSYSLSLDIPRLAIYGMGGDFLPSSILIQPPVVATVSFDMIVSDYEVPNIRNILCDPPQQSLTISLADCEGANIRSFTLPSGRFLDFTQNSSVTDNMTMTATYNAYYNNTGDILNIFS